MAENALHGAMADDLSLASWKTFCPSSSTVQAPCCPAMFIDFLSIQKIQANSSSCLTFVHASFYDRDKANMTEREWDAQFIDTSCHQKGHDQCTKTPVDIACWQSIQTLRVPSPVWHVIRTSNTRHMSRPAKPVSRISWNCSMTHRSHFKE